MGVRGATPEHAEQSDPSRASTGPRFEDLDGLPEAGGCHGYIARPRTANFDPNPSTWYTWYRNPWFALHKKRTQHGQLRSIAVCCGQSKTSIVLRQFAKVQVEELSAHRWLVYCQGEGRGFESRRPLQRISW